MNWTAQSYYNRLVKDAYNGNFPAMDPDDGPNYKMERNGKLVGCAVGILMPDDIKLGEYECQCVKDIPIDYYTIPEGMTLDDLAKCQNAHDSFWEGRWDGDEFVKLLNELPCFAQVTKKKVC